jgi:hypothetical protein
VRDPIHDYAPVSEPLNWRDAIGAAILLIIVAAVGALALALTGAF